MKGQARNIWKGTQTTKQHFFVFFFLSKLLLTYFRKYNAAFRNFFFHYLFEHLTYTGSYRYIVCEGKKKRKGDRQT